MPIQRCSKTQGLLQLVRVLPVISWSGGAIVLGLALTIRTGIAVNWYYLGLIIAAAIIFQGLLSHSFNDITDWDSGTDQMSLGILSGGSKVIRENKFTPKDLRFIGNGSCGAGIVLGVYFWHERGLLSLAFLFLALWAGIAYSRAPFRLAYRPLLGEWLVAFPAMAGLTLGTFFILSGSLSLLSLWAGVMHGVFSIAWLMQHHISDIPADLQARPCKLTTVSWLSAHRGSRCARYPVLLYFFLLIPAGLWGGFFLNPVFFISIIFALPCLCLSWFTEVHNVIDIAGKQKGMILLSLAHSFTLAILLATGY